MQLATYLLFKDQAAEAFDFYAQCLGGRVTAKVTMGEWREVDGELRATRVKLCTEKSHAQQTCEKHDLPVVRRRCR